MGQELGTPLKHNLGVLHEHLMQKGGADFDLGTATTITHNQFIDYILRLNDICSTYKDDENNKLIFAVKKDSDSTVFWKATVRIACIKYNTETHTVESHRMLHIREFLQLFRRITGEYAENREQVSTAEDNNTMENDNGTEVAPSIAGTSATTKDNCSREDKIEDNGCTSKENCANGRRVDPVGKTKYLFKTKGPNSVITTEMAQTSTAECNATNLEECIICLERKPDVILPCSHAYCTPCIEQWWEYKKMAAEETCALFTPDSDALAKNCPVCREILSDPDDAWVIPEVPDKDDVSKQLRKSLVGLASNRHR